MVSNKLYVLVNSKLRRSRKSRSIVAKWVARAVYTYTDQVRHLSVVGVGYLTDRGKRIYDQYVLNPELDLRWYSDFDQWGMHKVVMCNRDYRFVPHYETRDGSAQIMAVLITEASIIDPMNYDPDIDKDKVINCLLSEIKSLPSVT